MLKFMTKQAFITAVDERRFVVRNIKGNKYEVSMITTHEDGEGRTQFGLSTIVNPDTKDGYFNQPGGGFNKAHACIEDIAIYVDKNADDKDDIVITCGNYFMHKQRLNEI